jgi:hypothetical protein
VNLQTVKARASLVRVDLGAGARTLWRVSFPGSNVGFNAATLLKAIEMAYRARLALITARNGNG